VLAFLRTLESQVGQRRRKLGIPPFPWPGAWIPEEDRLLGTKSPPEAAKPCGAQETGTPVRTGDSRGAGRSSIKSSRKMCSGEGELAVCIMPI